jgi:squalene-hopene/tetraprenyl-beta-curcumene cyclase
MSGLRILKNCLPVLAISAALVVSACDSSSKTASQPAAPSAPNTPAPNPGAATNTPAANTPKPAAQPAALTGAKAEAKKLADGAWKWLIANYNKKSPDPKQPFDDTWGPDCNIAHSAFVLLGGLKCGLLAPDDPKVNETLGSILSQQGPDGGFYFGNGQRAVYITSVVIETLSWLRDNGGSAYKAKVDGPVGKAMKYIRSAQVGAKDGPLPDAKPESDINFGGWAYSTQELADPSKHGKPKGNMSTTVFALDAAAAFGIAKEDPLWQNAQTFLMRNQNSGEAAKNIEIKTPGGKPVADPPEDDPNAGGSRYSPDTSMAGETVLPDGRVLLHSYGSMTYALLRSYLHSGLPKTDTRVQLAAKWIARNFSVTGVPGYDVSKDPKADKQGYYYQFMQMSRTLALMGQDKIADARGIEHDWKAEMLAQLAKLQMSDGANAGMWHNQESSRWEEGTLMISTGYILNALGEVIAGK